MSIFQLVIQEIRHRRWNFLLLLAAMTVAVASLTGALTLLKAHELQTREILAAKQRETEAAIDKKRKQVEVNVARHRKKVELAGKKLNDTMRKITKNLGFNLLILPIDQDLNELYTQGTLSKTMPAEFAKRLSNSDVITINHLLPMVMTKLHWKEYQQDIILIGTQGEIPLKERALKKPLQKQVPKNTIVLGYEVHTRNNLKKGDKVKLMGETLTVSATYDQRGNKDDSSVWINLEQAQKLLKKENLINGMLALECNCATIDRVGEIRKDIERILPGTQVVEHGPPALARAEARNKAAQAAKDDLERVVQQGIHSIEQEKIAARQTLRREKQSRESLRTQRESFVGILVPIIIAASAIWIGLLTYGNMRQRQSEIGILRAIGLRSSQILTIFLSKSVLVGILGSMLGYILGFGIGMAWGGIRAGSATATQLFETQSLLLALLLAPVLSLMASWIPAIVAARQDPATVLQTN